MLEPKTCERIVDDLCQVYTTRNPMQRLTLSYPEMDIRDSYRIQEGFIARKLEAGAQIRGYKVGLTSKVMQEMAGSLEPDYSAMTDDMFLPEDTPVAASRFFTPMVEIEIAFVMKHDLTGPSVMPVDVIRATDFVLPALEIVDFRVARSPGYNITDSVADLAACGAVILGANPCLLSDIDVRRVRGSLKINGEFKAEGEASAVLGNPITSVAWLANKMHEFGTGFKAGDTILTGSFIRAFDLAPGDEIVSEFDQGMGSVAFSLTDA